MAPTSCVVGASHPHGCHMHLCIVICYRCAFEYSLTSSQHDFLCYDALFANCSAISVVVFSILTVLHHDVFHCLLQTKHGVPMCILIFMLRLAALQISGAWCIQIWYKYITWHCKATLAIAMLMSHCCHHSLSDALHNDAYFVWVNYFAINLCTIIESCL